VNGSQNLPGQKTLASLVKPSMKPVGTFNKWSNTLDRTATLKSKVMHGKKSFRIHCFKRKKQIERENMEYTINFEELECLARYWVRQLHINETGNNQCVLEAQQRVWQANQCLEMLATASRQAKQDLIEEYSFDGPDPDDWQPYGYDADDLSACRVSPHGYN
jgi:hypothetical protein